MPAGLYTRTKYVPASKLLMSMIDRPSANRRPSLSKTSATAPCRATVVMFKPVARSGSVEEWSTRGLEAFDASSCNRRVKRVDPAWSAARTNPVTSIVSGALPFTLRSSVGAAEDAAAAVRSKAVTAPSPSASSASTCNVRSMSPESLRHWW